MTTDDMTPSDYTRDVDPLIDLDYPIAPRDMKRGSLYVEQSGAIALGVCETDCAGVYLTHDTGAPIGYDDPERFMQPASQIKYWLAAYKWNMAEILRRLQRNKT